MQNHAFSVLTQWAKEIGQELPISFSIPVVCDFEHRMDSRLCGGYKIKAEQLTLVLKYDGTKSGKFGRGAAVIAQPLGNANNLVHSWQVRDTERRLYQVLARLTFRWSDFKWEISAGNPNNLYSLFTIDTECGNLSVSMALYIRKSEFQEALIKRKLILHHFPDLPQPLVSIIEHCTSVAAPVDRQAFMISAYGSASVAG